MIRQLLGKYLFNHFQKVEEREVLRVLSTGAEWKLRNLSLKEARCLILTAETRAQNQPEKLRMWFKYSRFYLYLTWYKCWKFKERFLDWLDRPFLK